VTVMKSYLAQILGAISCGSVCSSWKAVSQQ